jgi:hypothetical protein
MCAGRLRLLLLLLLLILLLLGLVSPGRAAEVGTQIPPMGAVEEGAYRAQDVKTGEELWQHGWRLVSQPRGGQVAVRGTQAGHGRRGQGRPVSWSLQMEAQLGGDRSRFWARREVRNTAGEVLEIEERELDPAHKTGMVKRQRGAGGQPEIRRFLPSRRTVDVEFLAFALRLLPTAATQRMGFDLVTGEGSVVVMEAGILGREVVRVPAGSFECYRVALAPTGVLGLAASLLLPKMLTWMRVEPPYIWVKSQGAEDGVGSREILRELVRFDSTPG